MNANQRPAETIGEPLDFTFHSLNTYVAATTTCRAPVTILGIYTHGRSVVIQKQEDGSAARVGKHACCLQTLLLRGAKIYPQKVMQNFS